MRCTERPYRWWRLWRKRLKGYVERKPVLALSGDEETVMDLRRGAERDGGRPISVANLLLANLLTQERFLAELGLKAEIQTWVTCLNSRLKWPPSYNVHPKLLRRIAKEYHQSHPYVNLPNGCGGELKCVTYPTGMWNYPLSR